MSTTTELEHQPAGHQKLTTIVVNGRQKEVAAKELSFVDVVRLAFEDAAFNDTTVYTVTYKRGHGPGGHPNSSTGGHPKFLHLIEHSGA